ncbi:MAG TPA: hypothetical protein VKI65_05180 [Gemmataceae bacterium]|nr:hypothetical protein [Gemmataceae bacterium]
MASQLPQKIINQMTRAGLPTSGPTPFIPRLVRNRKGRLMIEKKAIREGPKKGKRGYVDHQGRIWIRDWSHAGVPDHWDVQLEGGADYVRIDMSGNEVV